MTTTTLHALTPAQSYVLRAIARSFDTRGYAPTEREIAADRGCALTTIHEHIERCVLRGYLTRTPKARRGLALTELGRSLLPRPSYVLPVLGQVSGGNVTWARAVGGAA